MGIPMHMVAAAGYVFDENGNVLIVKTQHRGWECAGGQIEEGEDIETGVLREIFEESGVRATVRCLCGIYSNVGKYLDYDNKTPVPTKVLFDFICDYESGVLTPSDETREVIWTPKETVLDYITSPVMRYRMQKVMEFKGGVFYSSFVTKPEFRVISERIV